MLGADKAAKESDVQQLIYLAAFVLEKGESAASALGLPNSPYGRVSASTREKTRSLCSQTDSRHRTGIPDPSRVAFG